jgi:CheY-like chemotaxis protein
MTTSASATVCVLVVEDEPIIRELVEDILQEGGYVVALAGSGDEAIAMLEAEAEHYRALISDIYLGQGASGWDVARRARELNDDLPVVYISGGNTHEWASKGVPNSVIVTKPFAPVQIATAVSQLLNVGKQ